MEDDDPPTVSRMLKYLYTLDYGDGGPVLLEPDASATSENPGSETMLALDSDEPEAPDTLSDGKRPNENDMNIDATVQCKLMNNARVYALADKYAIPALMKLARDKFETWSHSVLEGLYNPDVIDLVFESTPDTDTGLRNIVIEICAGKVDSVLLDRDVCNEIEKHGDLGLGMLRKVIEQYDNKLCAANHCADVWRDWALNRKGKMGFLSIDET